MNTLIPGSDRTPTIQFQDGAFSIIGRSYMENSAEFYAPIKRLIEDYQGDLNVEINLDFFNTSSSKCIMDLLFMIDKKALAGNECKIKWSYKADDDDMRDAAEEFRDLLKYVRVELEEVDD